ncbi:sigma-54 dependent transcriptional regulator [Acinetobacter sp. ME22]|uniref:sigma-54 interaction domain-containing protein n=1 Tax=Acinetobacter sp. ME22 TaxID=2904802 RepID=UPI001EDAA4AF|nr:sigma-54 dependent transcriptional regulator [Acinetobacter sp. ME22]MCG2574642.1 sigma-54 dependent transcriptional regulator [Acinetobacter sp. ME22]
MTVVKHPHFRELQHSPRASAMVFEDPQSQQLLDYLQAIAPSQASVLITGETGTGKELIARQIHQLSERRDQPFIALNCGAFSETLVESELFGHEKGAFTGAHEARAGWFEAAHGGTIFLDEIGDLSLAIQVKLLRVLQENQVIRLGSRQTRRVNLRVIAATNVDLQQAVATGKFREDLYYRLNVAHVQLKPLRQRQGDILPLAQHFIQEYRQQLNAASIRLSQSAQNAMLTYPWPGNIRELENAIHRAVLLCQHGVIQPQDLQLHECGQSVAGLLQIMPNTSTLQQVLLHWFEQGLEHLDEQLEAEITQAAYAYCHQNQMHTAQLLGVSRNIIRARLLKHGLLKPSLRRAQAQPQSSSASAYLYS